MWSRLTEDAWRAPSVPARSPSVLLELLQGSAGNAAVVRLMRGGQPEIESAGRLAAGMSQGRPIRDDVRRQLERGTGAALEDVRIHTDARADTLAGALGARAFTTGRHIYFGPVRTVRIRPMAIGCSPTR
jgi:hypothetical protein